MHPRTFKYTFPGDGTHRSTTYYDVHGNVKFYPPVYEQRYLETATILADECWSSHFKKVVDFGCAEMRLFCYLRRLQNVQHIMEVDIDTTTLQINHQRVTPLITDFLQSRENPLRVEIYKGSVASASECLKNVDAVIAVELIEHLESDVLEKVPANVFGFIQPKLAIFTTPNADFNVIFNMPNNSFRHPDHKFEWTRKQFIDWALNICDTYPNYSVSIHGVGKAPQEFKSLGSVSQLAIFARNDIINRPLEKEILIDQPVNSDEEYVPIYAVDYPYFVDQRTKEEKILDEIAYQTNRCTHISTYYDEAQQAYKIPVGMLLSHASTYGCTEPELYDILQRYEYKVENEFVIMPDPNQALENDELDNYDDDHGGEDANDNDLVENVEQPEESWE